MEVKEILSILQDDIKVAIIASVDQDGKPHARPINIGVATEKGIFFMTSPKTNFYQQLAHNQNVAITALKQDDYLIQVIRIEGRVREIGREKLTEVLQDNPFVKHVYPNESDIAGVQVFHLYDGAGFYHSLTQGHKYVFSIKEDGNSVRSLT